MSLLSSILFLFIISREDATPKIYLNMWRSVSLLSSHVPPTQSPRSSTTICWPPLPCHPHDGWRATWEGATWSRSPMTCTARCCTPFASSFATTPAGQRRRVPWRPHVQGQENLRSQHAVAQRRHTLRWDKGKESNTCVGSPIAPFT